MKDLLGELLGHLVLEGTAEVEGAQLDAACEGAPAGAIR